MACKRPEVHLECPFKTRLLDVFSPTGGSLQHQAVDELDIGSLLPSSYRTGETGDDITSARQLGIEKCVEKELDLYRLHNVLEKLWSVGRPIPPRPLHHQMVLGREIFVTESMDMHLVWNTGRIFLKPLPRYLLEPQFWEQHLASDDHCSCMKNKSDADKSEQQSTSSFAEDNHDHQAQGRCYGGLRRRALGFLFSYAALIAYESDFHIAQHKHLLPKEVQWLQWRAFVHELKTHEIYDKIDERFKYGELRLSRLNKIYLGRLRLEGYLSPWTQYGSFLQDIFTFLASTTVLIAIILTAMQVGIGVDGLRDNALFNSASFGFTIFSILGPLIAVGIVVVVFLFIFVFNWVIAVKFWWKRNAKVQLLPRKSDSKELESQAIAV